MPLDAAQTVLLSKVKEMNAREIARKNAAFYRLSMLKDDFNEQAKAIIKRYVTKKETVERLSNMINTTVNVWKSVINEISMVFIDEPIRTFTRKGDPVEDSLETLLTEIYNKMKANQKFRITNKFMNAVNDVLLQVVFRNGNIDLDVITPNVFSISQSDNDLTRADVVVVDKIFDDLISDAGRNYRSYWTETTHYKVLSNGEKISVNEGDINPYGVMPFVFIHKELPTASFFDETSGSDLYECNLIASVLQTLIDMYFVWNSFKQLAIKTNQENLPSGIAISPDEALLIGQDDGVEILDFQIAIKALLESLKEYIVSVVQNYGVDWSTLVSGIKETSGTAYIVKNSKLQRIWRDQEKIFQDAEQDLFTIIKIFVKLHLGKDISDVQLKVKFQQPDIIKDDRNDLEIARKEIEMNLKDLVMVFMDRNKKVRNYEEAKQKLIQIIETNNELNGLVQKPVSDLFGSSSMGQEGF